MRPVWHEALEPLRGDPGAMSMRAWCHEDESALAWSAGRWSGGDEADTVSVATQQPVVQELYGSDTTSQASGHAAMAAIVSCHGMESDAWPWMVPISNSSSPWPHSIACAIKSMDCHVRDSAIGSWTLCWCTRYT
mmetsp:Transcript_28523/g.62782  ORF Transcript_28523/g.62782 Transcript_28523/m.62782 type:complete len:135 (-) Transcript_28523:599-1003(-)